MTQEKLGKVKEVTDLRSIWKDEAQDFTPWLAEEENMQILSDTLGISLRISSREARVGSFSADIVAKDEDDNQVIIENQLGDTNHDHLGKCLVYASGLNAKKIIWIVRNCRDEHRQAIDWLNKNTSSDIDFYLVRIKLIEIDGSKKAPIFVIVCQPNEETKAAKNSDKNLEDSEKRLSYLHFWEGLNSYIVDNGRNYPIRKAEGRRYHDFAFNSVNFTKCHPGLNVDYKSGVISCFIWIPDDMDLYNHLYENKDDIEKELGYKLNWDSKDSKKSSSITIDTDAYSSEYHAGNFEPCYEWLLEKLDDFIRVFRKYIN